MTNKTIVYSLNIAAAGFGFAAALLWYWASRIKTPTQLTQIVVDDVLGFGGELPELFEAVASQSKWNARAAVSAALSSALAALALAMGGI